MAIKKQPAKELDRNLKRGDLENTNQYIKDPNKGVHKKASKHPSEFKDVVVPELQPIDSKDIEEFRAKTWNDLPDYIRDKEGVIKEAYVEYAVAKYVCDNNPYRFFRFTNTLGEQRVIDLKILAYHAQITSRGGTSEQIAEAKKIRNEKVAPLQTNVGHKRIILNSLLRKYNHMTPLVEHLEEILDYLGKYYTIEEIQKIAFESWGYQASLPELKTIYVENRDVIENRRRDYVLNSRSYRIANEAGRLETLNMLLTDAQQRYKKHPTEAAINSIIKILEQARKEVKGEQLKLTMEGTIDIRATLQGQDSVFKCMRSININSIVIGLTAAKAGLNPTVIIGQLANSWYKDVNGFNNNILGNEQVLLPGALIKQYDWGELKEQSNKFVSDMSPIKEVIDVPIIREEIVENKRKSLLKALESYKNKTTVADYIVEK